MVVSADRPDQHRAAVCISISLPNETRTQDVQRRVESHGLIVRLSSCVLTIIILYTYAYLARDCSSCQHLPAGMPSGLSLLLPYVTWPIHGGRIEHHAVGPGNDILPVDCDDHVSYGIHFLLITRAT